MNPRTLALEYLARFCAGDIDGVATLLASDLKFTGAFHRYGSAAQYLEGLREDPPEVCDYHVLALTQSQDLVGLFYRYLKPTCEMLISQWFRVEGARIRNIVLVMDGRSRNYLHSA